MSEQKTLLVYDGNCTYCSYFARMLRRLDSQQQFHLMTYQSPQAQKILSAQFGEHIGFTLYLFKDQVVYWAQSAAREVVRQLGLPSWVGWLALKAYPMLTRVISRLIRRGQSICAPGHEQCINTQTTFGSMRLTEQATVQLNALKTPKEAFVCL